MPWPQLELLILPALNVAAAEVVVVVQGVAVVEVGECDRAAVEAGVVCAPRAAAVVLRSVAAAMQLCGLVAAVPLYNRVPT